jgi:PTH1 family peptidyl-tRNA hydrolase
MAGADRLIVGLGNPGPEYEDTRHNVGFWVVNAVAETARAAFHHDGRANAMVAEGRTRGRPLTLVQPLTFMNRSGQTVKHLVRRFSLRPRDVLVVYDDLNLEVGRLRLRQRGSAGGHNGVQDIIDRLGTDDFPRLRIGIGSDFRRGRQVDYVLSPFDADQEPLIDEALDRAHDAVITFVTDGIVTAMNRFN